MRSEILHEIGQDDLPKFYLCSFPRKNIFSRCFPGFAILFPEKKKRFPHFGRIKNIVSYQSDDVVAVVKAPPPHPCGGPRCRGLAVFGISPARVHRSVELCSSCELFSKKASAAQCACHYIRPSLSPNSRWFFVLSSPRSLAELGSSVAAPLKLPRAERLLGEVLSLAGITFTAGGKLCAPIDPGRLLVSCNCSVPAVAIEGLLPCSDCLGCPAPRYCCLDIAVCHVCGAASSDVDTCVSCGLVVHRSCHVFFDSVPCIPKGHWLCGGCFALFCRAFHAIDRQAGFSMLREGSFRSYLDLAAGAVIPYPGVAAPPVPHPAGPGDVSVATVALVGAASRTLSRRVLRIAGGDPVVPWCPPLHLDPVVLSALGSGPCRSPVWASACGFLMSLPVFHHGISLPWEILLRRLGAVCASAADGLLSPSSCSIIAGSFLARFRYFGLKDLSPLPPAAALPAQCDARSPSVPLNSHSPIACSESMSCSWPGSPASRSSSRGSCCASDMVISSPCGSSGSSMSVSSDTSSC